MSGKEDKGKKRSKSYYRKCAYGAKKARQGAYTLEPGIKGFLVMCNTNESGAVRESYNILNEYADLLFGSEQASSSSLVDDCSEEEDDDVEKALQKEVEEIKNTDLKQKRFQNVKTKAKNCIFIQSTVEDPVTLALKVMEDIAQNGLRKARYAARILPILGTCKAHTDEIEKLAKSVLSPIFSSSSSNVPSSYTILYKIRNNNAKDCGKNQVISAIRTTMSQLNPQVKFTWTDYQVAVIVEVVCTVCCLGVAPDYARLRKYNLQELQQGPKVLNPGNDSSNQDDKSILMPQDKSEEQGPKVLNPGNDSSYQDDKSIPMPQDKSEEQGPKVLNTVNGSSYQDDKSKPMPQDKSEEQGPKVLNTVNGSSYQDDKSIPMPQDKSEEQCSKVLNTVNDSGTEDKSEEQDLEILNSDSTQDDKSEEQRLKVLNADNGSSTLENTFDEHGLKVLKPDNSSRAQDKSEEQDLGILNSDHASSTPDDKSEEQRIQLLNTDNGSDTKEEKSEEQGLKVLNSDSG